VTLSRACLQYLLLLLLLRPLPPHTSVLYYRRIEELKRKEEALRSQEGKIKQHLLDSLVGGAEASSLDPFASTSSGTHSAITPCTF
jgi:hypothetical protein